MTDQAASADTLVELLEAQQALVEELSLLAARQPPLIEAGESDGLLALLADSLRRLKAGQRALARLEAESPGRRRQSGRSADRAGGHQA